MDDIYSDIEKLQERADSFIPEADFDKEAWAAKKQAERQAAFNIIDIGTERVTEDLPAFREFLYTMARFPNYSVANTLLIFEQRPDATRVGDFDYWLRQGESVRRGESGIIILEPGDEYTRKDGSIGVSYKTKKVFDIAQTSSRLRQPRYPDERSAVKALVASSPVSIKTVESLEGGKAAVFDKASNTISVTKGLDGDTIFKVLAEELSHASLAGNDSAYDREANSETAQASAYVLARRYGIDTRGLKPAFTLRSSTDSLQEVREELGRIRDAAKEITTQMNKTLEAARSQSQERGGRDVR